MKKGFLAAMVVAVCVALVVPAFAGGNGNNGNNGNGNAAGGITVMQDQSQGIRQFQGSIGGYGVSTQGYATRANQGYAIQKTGDPSGFAAAKTGNVTSGSQVRFGSGANVQGMLGGSSNYGGLSW